MIENRLASLLASKNLDKRDLVKMSKVDRHIIDKIYKNKTKRIDLETLNKLCFALECNTIDIFRYVPDENPPA